MSTDNHQSQNIAPNETEANEPLPTALDILLETGEILGDATAHKYIEFFSNTLNGYLNTTLNPKRLELSSFTKVLIVKEAFFPPPMDKDIALPSAISLLQYVIEKNGKKANFSVEMATKQPATFMFEVSQAFNQ